MKCVVYYKDVRMNEKDREDFVYENYLVGREVGSIQRGLIIVLDEIGRQILDAYKVTGYFTLSPHPAIEGRKFASACSFERELEGWENGRNEGLNDDSRVKQILKRNHMIGQYAELTEVSNNIKWFVLDRDNVVFLEEYLMGKGAFSKLKNDRTAFLHNEQESDETESPEPETEKPAKRKKIKRSLCNK